MSKKEKYEFLPLTDIKDVSFFFLEQSKTETKINNLVNKYIIFELWDKEDHSVQVIPGKLLEFKDNNLFIRQYDDGTKETQKLWTEGNGNDLFKDWQENIPIENIKGIEEYKIYNSKLKFKNKYRNNICEIINKDNKKIKALIIDYDNLVISFQYKYKDNNEICLGSTLYPICFIKDIKIVSELN